MAWPSGGTRVRPRACRGRGRRRVRGMQAPSSSRGRVVVDRHRGSARRTPAAGAGTAGRDLGDPSRRVDAALEAGAPPFRCRVWPARPTPWSPSTVSPRRSATSSRVATAPALQPGPDATRARGSATARSWQRRCCEPGAAMARAQFIRWFAPFQREDGFVPCCVDRDGVDPAGRARQPRATDLRGGRTPAFHRRRGSRRLALAALREGRGLRRNAEGHAHDGRIRKRPRPGRFGLLPESVSHEGYLSQPVHSYWDDFWALRGLRDAAR